MIVELTCPHAAYQSLVEAIHRAKPGTKAVKVSAMALEALIIDHSRLLREVPHKEPTE